MGESAFRRLKLCTDGSHWLDTLSVSNSSSRNWNNWFVAMITSLNIVAKTFAKIVKTFARLSATIIATRRKLVLILHLETKYAKMDCKNEIYAKNLVMSTWIAKSQRLRKINGQSQQSNPRVKRWRQRLTQVSDVSNAQRGLTSATRSEGWRQQEGWGTWKRVRAREGAWPARGRKQRH